MNLCPCKNCTKRTIGCHSNCEDYHQFREDIDYQHSNRNKEHFAEAYQIEVRRDYYKRNRNKRK